MLLYLMQETAAPFYATVVLLATNQVFGKRLAAKDLVHFLYETGKVLAELVAILGAIGLIVGSLAVTGLTGSLRSEEHTSELQSLMRISYAVFCLKKKKAHTI